MQPGTLWPQLPLVSTQHEIEDLHSVWEAASMMRLALTNVEAKAVMRTERARRMGIASTAMPTSLSSASSSQSPFLRAFGHVYRKSPF